MNLQSHQAHEMTPASNPPMPLLLLLKKPVPHVLTLKGTTPSGKPRLYVCNTCTRAFARQEHLKRHERSHTQEKPFVCGVCERLFSRRDLLLRHAQKLHSGCADAVTRIRKRSLRRKSSSLSSSEPMSRKSSVNTPPSDHHPALNNPFANIKIEMPTLQNNYPDLPPGIMTNSTVSPCSPRHTDTMKRRASFSAVSSANYAMPIPNTSYLESVEFSTPSVAQSNWLNGLELDSIPELSLFDLDQPKIEQNTNQAELPNLTGYSFYENDEDPPVVESLFNNNHLFKTPGTIKRDEYSSPDVEEDEDDDDDDLRRSSASSFENNIDRNLNEIEEITDLNIPKMYDMPAGYSFYGNADQQSNSASSNATISPSLLDAHNGQSNISTPPQKIVIQTANTLSAMLNLDIYSRVYLFSPILRSHINHTLSNYPFVGVKVPNLPSNSKMETYTKNFVKRFLPHYPFIHRSMLNEYSLMKSTLDDTHIDALVSMNQLELNNLRASISCLPLLVATIGALLSDEKQDASSLYEVSRRCIHVYLDSRKKKSSDQHSGHRGGANTAAGLNNNNASPLWLIQSLTLSVIYGLFADSDISINVVIRQVNALTALVKSSEMTKIKWNYNSVIQKERSIDQNYYYDFIKYESAVRTVHSIFNVVVSLTSLYNIAPSLKIDDLELDLPNSSMLWNSSNYAEFKNYYSSYSFQPETFKKCLNNLISLDIMSTTNELNKSGGFFFLHHVSDFGLICLQNGLHQLFYYDKLYGINTRSTTRQNSYQSISSSMKRDSLKENYISICRIWNSMIDQCKFYNQSNELIKDSKLMNYHLLLKKSVFKSEPQFGLRLHKLKEQVWLKDWDKMCDIFDNSDSINKDSSNNEIPVMMSYCLLILREVFYPNLSEQVVNHNSIQTQYLRHNENLMMEIESFQEQLYTADFNLEHLIKISSLNLQILFDCFLIMTKFVMNYDTSVHEDLSSFKNSPNDEMEVDSPSIEHSLSLSNSKIYDLIVKLVTSLQKVFEEKFEFTDGYKNQLDNFINFADKHNDEFTGFGDMMNTENSSSMIQREKLLNKLFKLIDFVFDYLIYNKVSYKFGCLKNLNCGLIKLNFHLLNGRAENSDIANGFN